MQITANPMALVFCQQEIQAISQESMHQVREIVENLKQRTLARELETVKQMLEVAQVKVEIQNELDTASISPILESALAMVSLELATNMIKHAKATQALLSYRSTRITKNRVNAQITQGFKNEL